MRLEYRPAAGPCSDGKATCKISSQRTYHFGIMALCPARLRGSIPALPRKLLLDTPLPSPSTEAARRNRSSVPSGAHEESCRGKSFVSQAAGRSQGGSSVPLRRPGMSCDLAHRFLPRIQCWNQVEVASPSEKARKLALDRFRLLHLEQKRPLRLVAAEAGIPFRDGAALGSPVPAIRADGGARRGTSARIKEANEGLALQKPSLPNRGALSSRTTLAQEIEEQTPNYWTVRE